uniref:Uncharacterized protein n=1 Tax=Cucumis melo TaxID=3656 RepID=A0A9I9CUP0_CUCME
MTKLWGGEQATCAAAKRADDNRLVSSGGCLVYRESRGSENRDEAFSGRGKDSESRGGQTLLT